MIPMTDLVQAPRKCELNCMPKGERFYLMQAKKVKRYNARYDWRRTLTECKYGKIIKICEDIGKKEIIKIQTPWNHMDHLEEYQKIHRYIA